MKHTIFLSFLLSCGSLLSFSFKEFFSKQWLRSWFTFTRLSDVFEIDSIQNQGNKPRQEDTIALDEISAGVFDGHGPEPHFIFKKKNIENNQNLHALIEECKRENLISLSPESSEVHKEIEYICTGENAAQWFVQKVPLNIKKNLFGWQSWILWLKAWKTKFPVEAIKRAHFDAQKEYCKKIELLKKFSCSEPSQTLMDPGTTSVLATLYKDYIYVSHMGDSRMVILDDNFEQVYASKDHNPQNKKERERLDKEGIKIIDKDGCERVAGLFMPSRSLGHYFKQIMSAPGPKIKQVPLEKAAYMVAGSDGFFDYLHFSPLAAEERVQEYRLEYSQQNKVLALLFEKYKSEKRKSSIAGLLTEEAQNAKSICKKLLEDACKAETIGANFTLRQDNPRHRDIRIEPDMKYEKSMSEVALEEGYVKDKRRSRKTHDNISVVLALRRKGLVLSPENDSLPSSSSSLAVDENRNLTPQNN